MIFTTYNNNNDNDDDDMYVGNNPILEKWWWRLWWAFSFFLYKSCKLIFYFLFYCHLMDPIWFLIKLIIQIYLNEIICINPVFLLCFDLIFCYICLSTNERILIILNSVVLFKIKLHKSHLELSRKQFFLKKKNLEFFYITFTLDTQAHKHL